jgi:hypothetical protein
MGAGAVGGGIDVGPAGKEETVQSIEQLIRIFRRRIVRRQQHGESAGRLHGAHV